MAADGSAGRAFDSWEGGLQRMRVANISEKNAACGAYIAPWKSRATVTAVIMAVKDSLRR
ncbi:hypothetical protein [Streptomyces sp. 135]|uniref:hypothetical protein n=1 Tax=Streptomyces sp. 135 TaxID=2838850 RepID=UPI001CBD9858|nr:hypothetical protein [Streptomyces sp. 135]